MRDVGFEYVPPNVDLHVLTFEIFQVNLEMKNLSWNTCETIKNQWKTTNLCSWIVQYSYFKPVVDDIFIYSNVSKPKSWW